MRKRNKSIYIRMTEDEYENVIKKIGSSGQTIQSYIINASLNGRISSAEEVAELKNRSRILEDIDRQLRGMGTNLNQLAHIANGQGSIPTSEELVKISCQVKRIKDEVKDAWLSTRQSISQQKLMEQ